MKLDAKVKQKIQAAMVAAGEDVATVAAMSDEDIANWYIGQQMGGATDDAADPNAAAAAGGGNANIGGDPGAMGAVDPTKKPAAAPAAMSARIVELTNRVGALSAFAPVGDDSLILGRLQLYTAQADAMVQAGTCTVAQATAFKNALVVDKKPVGLLLSHTVGNPNPFAAIMLSILGAGGKIPATGVTTADQSLSLAANDPAKGGAGGAGAGGVTGAAMTTDRKSTLLGSLAHGKAPASRQP